MRELTASVILFLLLALSLPVKAETWKIATLEWPPYVCSQCPQNGAAASALRQALKTKGIKIEFSFYPWIQTLRKGGERTFTGYFPAWKEEIGADFTASEALFSSPIVFLERKEHPLNWAQLKDLKGKMIGVTKGYGNTKEFNDLVKSGVIKTSEILSEDSLFQKLEQGHVDGVLMDLFVAKYYLTEIFPNMAAKIQINPRIIEVKTLHFAFNKYNSAKSGDLQETLKGFNFNKAVDGWLKEQKQADMLLLPTYHSVLSLSALRP